jgi:hypothetical protein
MTSQGLRPSTWADWLSRGFGPATLAFLAATPGATAYPRGRPSRHDGPVVRRVGQRGRRCRRKNKTPVAPERDRGFGRRCLAVTYSHMGRPHTTIGAGRFHFRVRNGIGWFPPAIAARQALKSASGRHRRADYNLVCPDVRSTAADTFVQCAETAHPPAPAPNRARSLGCYMVKPHGQLVLVSYTRCRASTSSLSTS